MGRNGNGKEAARELGLAEGRTRDLLRAEPGSCGGKSGGRAEEEQEEEQRKKFYGTIDR